MEIESFIHDLPIDIQHYIYEKVLEIHPFSPDAIAYIPTLQDMLKGMAL